MADVLKVGPEEGVGQIQARLARTRSRQVYLYLPEANQALRHRLPLTLLRRTADDLGLDLTIVTHDTTTRMMAGSVGLSVRWRLPRLEDGKGKRESGIGKGENGMGVLAPSVPSSVSHTPSSTLGSPIAVVALAIMLLVLGLVSAILVLPHATVIVTPITTSIEATIEIVGDPAASAVDVAGRRIPARRLEVTLDREAREPTSARVDIPDEPARGTVVFVNQSEAEVVIPAGSRITTESGAAVVFRTQETVVLPAPAGTTARARVEAVQPGVAGNVPAYTLTVLDPALGLPVAVVNDQPMSGGAVRSVGIVTQEERERVRNALLERMWHEALQALQTQVREEETLVESSVGVDVIEERYSAAPDTIADVITVGLAVRAVGTVVNLHQARQLAEEVLQQQVPAGQLMLADSVSTKMGPAVGLEGGQVWLEATSKATAQPQIKASDVVRAVQGRPVDEALMLLREKFPLSATPVIRLSRGWLGRMPWLPMRIDVIIRGGSTRMGEIQTDETNHGFGRG